MESLVGWSWDALEDDWNQGFDSLAKYVSENGDARVPARLKTDDGFSLGQWITTQRKNYHKGQLSQEQIKQLESLVGWSWDPLEDNWNEGFESFAKYVPFEPP